MGLSEAMNGGVGAEARRPLLGKVAIVTGAGRDTGAKIARSLAAAGARVAVNDINPDRAERIAAEIRFNDGQAIGIMADVSNKFQCVTLVEATRAEWGQLDILVNNASVKPGATILKMDEWDWQRCLDVNLKGTFFMSQLCGRVMADENAERGGVIVNIALLGRGDDDTEHLAAFQASKAGVLGFSQACAREFNLYGIRVYALLNRLRSTGPGDLIGEDLALTLASRGSGVENTVSNGGIADAVLHLCSSADAAPTGSAITID